MALDLPGAARISYILKAAKKETNLDPATTKATREEDMVKRVLAVQAAVSSRFPLAVFSNVLFKKYVTTLDPKHRLPHHLETNRIIEVMIDGMFQEFQRIRGDCRRAVSHGDLCLTQDFVTDTNRRESFGVIVVDFVAEKYEMEDGRFLHMSKQTASNAKHEMLTVSLSCMFISLFTI